MSSTRSKRDVHVLIAAVAATLLVARVSAHDVGSLPSNPAIVALVDEVSADSLHATMSALVAFGTRHFNSDTLSQTIGVGAARRWVAARLAAAGGGGLATRYVSFDTTTCALYRVHRNVVATHDGSAALERAFLVSAHLDSRTVDVCDRFSPAPGANDDASGVALVLEMARLLANVETDADLMFVAMATEEFGLLGSRALAASLAADGVRLDGMVTNDIVGNITGCADPACPPGEPVIVDSLSVRHFSRGPSSSAHRQLTRAMALAAMRYVPELSVTLVPSEDRPMRGGDHLPFSDLGVASARFTEANEDGDGTGENGHQHNGDDTLDRVNVPYLARITRLNLAGFANLAMAPESPDAPAVVPLGEGRLEVSWPAVTTAPDLAGYRVALRRAFGDSLFYFRVEDAGLDPDPTQTHLLTGVDETLALHVSVSAYDAAWNESIFSPETFVSPTVDAQESEPHATTRPALAITGAPDAAVVHVRLVAPRQGRVVVDVLDAAGRRVALVLDAERESGSHELAWHARRDAGREPLASGIYFVRFLLDGELEGVAKLPRVR